MRKVIPYIASQFRKDRIWLRRTKPAQRNYQIVLAVDDSSRLACNATSTHLENFLSNPTVSSVSVWRITDPKSWPSNPWLSSARRFACWKPGSSESSLSERMSSSFILCTILSRMLADQSTSILYGGKLRSKRGRNLRLTVLAGFCNNSRLSRRKRRSRSWWTS